MLDKLKIACSKIGHINVFCFSYMKLKKNARGNNADKITMFPIFWEVEKWKVTKKREVTIILKMGPRYFFNHVCKNPLKRVSSTTGAKNTTVKNARKK